MPHQQGVSEAVSLLKGKWTIPVMAVLALEELQNKDILVTVNTEAAATNGSGERVALSPRVLADTLQRAVEDGLVHRNAEEGTFGAVRYRLTTKGRALLRAAFPLAEWALKYHSPA